MHVPIRELMNAHTADGIRSHPQAAVWWLRIVAADPAYLDCLTLSTCACWLRDAASDKESLWCIDKEPLWCIDKDGDVYTLNYTEQVLYVERYNMQVVVDDGVVRPCTPTIRHYLLARNAQLAEGKRSP